MPTTRKRASPPLGSCTARVEPDADAQRLGQPDADLGLVAAAQAPPGVERRVLEARVVAGEGDELDRLAEREGVGALHDVARRGVGDAGQRADLGRAVGGQAAR